MPVRAAVILLAACPVFALMLAGCDNKKRERAEFAHADAVTKAPPIPTEFKLTTPDAQVQMALPQGIDGYPSLHAKLYNDGKQELTEFAAQAAEDRARFAKKGVSQPTPYERRIVWTITAISPHLISLREAWYDDTGGLHPDHGSGVLLWDRVHNQQLLQSELFKPDADFKAMDAELCVATTKAKDARVGPSDPKSWTCPTFAESNAILVPSTAPYRIGGMMFLFDPHLIGAYAEGDYEVLIPQSAFQSILARPLAVDFVGSPAPMIKPRP